MKKFKSFGDLGSYVQDVKKERYLKLINLLKNGILIDSLSHFEKKDLKYCLRVESIDKIDYIFENKDKISPLEWMVVESLSWNTFVMQAFLTEPETNNKIEISAPFFINEMINSDYFKIGISPLFLKESFVKDSLKKEYSEEDLAIINFNNEIFTESEIINHVIAPKYLMKINEITESIEYIKNYEFYTRKKINAGFGRSLVKISDTHSPDFIEKVKDYIETEYTLPLIDKRINEMTENDITVIKMSLI